MLIDVPAPRLAQLERFYRQLILFENNVEIAIAAPFIYRLSLAVGLDRASAHGGRDEDSWG